MAKSKLSQAKRVNSFLQSGYLDLDGTSFGKDEWEARPIDLNNVADILFELALLFRERLEQKLIATDRNADGFLTGSIEVMPVEILGKTATVSISLADYYKFVDEGVKGWQDEKGGASPYQFKKTPAGKAMMESIRKWVIKEGLKGRGKENRKGSIRSRKRSTITDTSTRTAYAISNAIKKRGLAPSYFFTDTVEEMRPIIREALGKALKVSIIETITK